MKLMSIFLIFGLFFSGSAGAQDLVNVTDLYGTQLGILSTTHVVHSPSTPHHDVYSFISEADSDELETIDAGDICAPPLEVSSAPSPQVIHAIASSHRSRWLEYASLLVNSPPFLA